MADFWPSPATLPSRMRNLLSRKPIEKINLSLTANFLFSTIQSYPEMLSTFKFPSFRTSILFWLKFGAARASGSKQYGFHGHVPAEDSADEKDVFKTLFTEAQRLHNEASLDIA
jgi:hypothetical protein